MMRVLLAAALVLAACGDDDPDPCAQVATACIALHVDSDTVTRVDQLELDILYGELHATTSTQADGGRVVELPLTAAIALDTDDTVEVGLVAAGKLSGAVQGTGAASATLDAGEHISLALHLAPAEDCVAGSFYCGGDMVAGDPDTLYECNAGGVPLARGRCAGGCIVQPADDDACRGVGGACVEGSRYCGGDKVDGDPQSLYTCTGGVGTNRMECADGCVVNAGDDDACR